MPENNFENFSEQSSAIPQTPEETLLKKREQLAELRHKSTNPTEIAVLMAEIDVLEQKLSHQEESEANFEGMLIQLPVLKEILREEKEKLKELQNKSVDPEEVSQLMKDIFELEQEIFEQEKFSHE